MKIDDAVSERDSDKGGRGDGGRGRRDEDRSPYGGPATAAQVAQERGQRERDAGEMAVLPITVAAWTVSNATLGTTRSR